MFVEAVNHNQIPLASSIGKVFLRWKWSCTIMEREDIARIAIGLMVLLLPYAGAFTVLPLAAVFFLDRGSRLLSASLAMLLIMRTVLAITDTNLPLYVIAISFVASTFAPLAFR